LITKVNDVYPGSDVFLIEDGVEQKTFTGCRQFKETDHLKVPMCGGAWTHRYLQKYLKLSEADYLIKLDPDTKVLNPVQDLPEKMAIFAAVSERKAPNGTVHRVPHGGALGFTRNVAEWLVSSNAFLDQRFMSNIRYRSQQDIMLRDLAAWRELPLIDRPDFACGPTRKKTKTSTFYHA
jgi:hypothetical protein